MNYKKSLAGVALIAALAIIPLATDASLLSQLQLRLEQLTAQFNKLISQSRSTETQSGAVATVPPKKTVIISSNSALAMARSRVLPVPAPKPKQAKAIPDQSFNTSILVNGLSTGELVIDGGATVPLTFSATQPGFGSANAELALNCTKNLTAPVGATVAGWTDGDLQFSQWDVTGTSIIPSSISFNTGGIYTFSLACTNLFGRTQTVSSVINVTIIVPVINHGVKIVQTNGADWTGVIWRKGETRRLVWNPNYFIKPGVTSVDVYLCKNGATDIKNVADCTKMTPSTYALDAKYSSVDYPFVWVPESFTSTGPADQTIPAMKIFYLAVGPVGGTKLSDFVATKNFSLSSYPLSIINPSNSLEFTGGNWKQGDQKLLGWVPAGFGSTNIDFYICKGATSASNCSKLNGDLINKNNNLYKINLESAPTSFVGNLVYLVATMNCDGNPLCGLTGAFQRSRNFTLTPATRPTVSSVSVANLPWTAGQSRVVSWVYRNFTTAVKTVSLSFCHPSTGACTPFADASGNPLILVPSGTGNNTGTALLDDPILPANVLANTLSVRDGQTVIKVCPTASLLGGIPASTGVCASSGIVNINTQAPITANVDIKTINAQTGATGSTWTGSAWQRGEKRRLVWNPAYFIKGDYLAVDIYLCKETAAGTITNNNCYQMNPATQDTGASVSSMDFPFLWVPETWSTSVTGSKLQLLIGPKGEKLLSRFVRSNQIFSLDSSALSVRVIKIGSTVLLTGGENWSQSDSGRVYWEPRGFGSANVDVYICQGVTSANNCTKINTSPISNASQNSPISLQAIPQKFVGQTDYLVVAMNCDGNPLCGLTGSYERSRYFTVQDDTTVVTVSPTTIPLSSDFTVNWTPTTNFGSNNVDVLVCPARYTSSNNIDGSCLALATNISNSGTKVVHFPQIPTGNYIYVRKTGDNSFAGNAYSDRFTTTDAVSTIVTVPDPVTKGRDFTVTWSPTSYWAGATRITFWLCPRNDISLYPGDGSNNTCRAFNISDNNTGSKVVPASVSQNLPVRSENYLLVTKDNTSTGAFSNKFAITDISTPNVTPATVTVTSPVYKVPDGKFGVTWSPTTAFGTAADHVGLMFCTAANVNNCRGAYSGVDNTGSYNNISTTNLATNENYLYVKKNGDSGNTWPGNNFSNRFDVVPFANPIVNGPIMKGTYFDITWNKEAFYPANNNDFVTVTFCSARDLSTCKGGQDSFPNNGKASLYANDYLTVGDSNYVYIKKNAEPNHIGNAFSNQFTVVPYNKLKLTITGGIGGDVSSDGAGTVPAVFYQNSLYGFKVENTGSSSSSNCTLQVGGYAGSVDDQTRTFSFVGDKTLYPSENGLVNPEFTCKIANSAGTLSVPSYNCGKTYLANQRKDNTAAFLKCDSQPIVSVPMRLKPDITKFDIRVTRKPWGVGMPQFTYDWTVNSGVSTRDKNIRCVLHQQTAYSATRNGTAEIVDPVTIDDWASSEFKIDGTNGSYPSRMVSEPSKCNNGQNNKNQICRVNAAWLTCRQINTNETAMSNIVTAEIIYGYQITAQQIIDFTIGILEAINSAIAQLPTSSYLAISKISSGNDRLCPNPDNLPDRGYQTDQHEDDVRSPAMAIDASKTTFWSSCTKYPTNWLWLDLGGKKTLSKIELVYGSNGAKETVHYAVDVSSDGVNYQRIVTDSFDCEEVAEWGEIPVTISLANTKARYLKLIFPGPEVKHTTVYDLKVVGLASAEASANKASQANFAPTQNQVTNGSSFPMGTTTAVALGKLEINGVLSPSQLTANTMWSWRWNASNFTGTKLKVYSCYNHLSGNPASDTGRCKELTAIRTNGLSYLPILDNSGTYSFQFTDSMVATPTGCARDKKLFTVALADQTDSSKYILSTPFSLSGIKATTVCPAITTARARKINQLASALEALRQLLSQSVNQ